MQSIKFIKIPPLFLLLCSKQTTVVVLVSTFVKEETIQKFIFSIYNSWTELLPTTLILHSTFYSYL